MSSIPDTQVFTTNYLVQPNPRYDFKHKATDTYILQNIAEDVNYNVVSTTSSNRHQLSFQIDPANFFMDRGVFLNIDLPLLFTRHVATTEPTVVESNYVQNFFDDFNSFAWKQFAFLNAIQSISLIVDGWTHTVSDVSDMLTILSRYLDEDVIHQRIPASLPDCMDYPNYLQAAESIKTVPLNAGKLWVKPSIINTHSPFGTMGNPDFNTRVPAISFESCDATKRILKGTISSQQCFLPFSLFGLSGVDVDPIKGIKSITLKIQLKSEWVKHLFSSAVPATAATSISVDLDTDRANMFVVDLRYRTYNAPAYIVDAHNLSSGTAPDSTNKFNLCELVSTLHDVDFAPDKETVTVSNLTYKINAIPRSVYLAAVLKPSNDDELTRTPAVFARINGLHVELAGKKTLLPSHPVAVMDIAKANGLQDSMEIGYYLGGFPLKLNITDDLAAKSNSVVGSRQNIQNELRITNLVLSNVARAGKAATYTIKMVAVYDSMLTYQSGKFQLFNSLLDAEPNLSIDAHVSALYNNQIDGGNVIGGAWNFAKLLPVLKKGAKGAYNLGKKFMTDSAFRSTITDAFNGKIPGATSTPTAGYSSHIPGGYSSNQIGGFVSGIQGGASVAQLRY